MRILKTTSLASAALLLGCWLSFAGCSDDDATPAGGTAATGGTAGNNAAGTSSSGTGGTAAGTGGTAAGTGGTVAGGSGGATTGGAAGESTAGTSGGGGSEAGGAAGTAGVSGQGGASGGQAGSGGSSGAPSMSFFVSSTGSGTANLGGLAGADKRCQDLAAAVGAGNRTWQAYLSVEKGPDDGPIDARDRIGKGPWYNAKLVMIAADLASLHERFGDADVFLDEKGEKVPGQWAGSPMPNQHDILTGTKRDGTVEPGKTCGDWTSADPTKTAIVGHSDGLGPGGSDAPMYRPWNAVHENGNCGDTAPKGGSGRVYCFAID